MSGIAGYIETEPRAPAFRRVRAMLASIRHRGPDGEGIGLGNRHTGVFGSRRTDDTAESEGQPLQRPGQVTGIPDVHDFALIAARYAVVDRCAAPAQPFVIGDGAMIGVFDGRIHNARELRDTLSAEGFSFRTGLDIEVLLKGYHRWGSGLWPRLNGFWATALFDAGNRKLVLSRDRLGIAPLYWCQGEGTLLFGSTIASVVAAAPGRPEMRRSLVRGFIETGLKDLDGRTCWRSVRSLEPGVAVELGPGQSRLQEGRKYRFWDFPERPYTTDDLSFREARTRVRDLLFDAVKLRLRADRNVAFELSGGIDSSAVVAAAAVQGEQPTTYTLKVPERDEEPYARTLLDRHDVDYRVVSQDHSSFPEHAERFAEAMEEPFRSANVWEHQRLLRRMKHDGAGVVLTGSGGGYDFAEPELDFWPAARRALFERGHGLQARLCGLLFKFGSWKRAKRTIRWMFPADAGVLNGRESSGASRPDGSGTPPGAVAKRFEELDFFQRRLFHLRNVDMPYALLMDDHLFASVPLEMRTPFLDHRLVEVGLRLPPEYLFHRGYTKWVLRKAMEPYLPSEILWLREKFGFPFPLRRFLREHRDFLTKYFQRIRAEDFLRGTERRTWDEVLAIDPQCLWRICSTGMWMDVADIRGGAV